MLNQNEETIRADHLRAFEESAYLRNHVKTITQKNYLESKALPITKRKFIERIDAAKNEVGPF